MRRGETVREPAPFLDGPFMTAEDVARLCRVPKRTVYAWVDQGILPSRRVGPRLLRFTSEDLDALQTRSEARS